VYSSSWTAQEELLLLEGIQKFGFGNWQDIAEHLGTKTAIEIESHYENIYLSGR